MRKFSVYETISEYADAAGRLMSGLMLICDEDEKINAADPATIDDATKRLNDANDRLECLLNRLADDTEIDDETTRKKTNHFLNAFKSASFQTKRLAFSADASDPKTAAVKNRATL